MLLSYTRRRRSSDTLGGSSLPILLRKLLPDEAANVFPKRGQMDLSEYSAALRDLQPGDSAEVELQGLSSRALKRRLGQAVNGTGYRLKWARSSSNHALYFQVTEVASTKPVNRRRSRRRRAAA